MKNLLSFLLLNLSLTVCAMEQQEMVTLHTGEKVSQKAFQSTWPALKEFATYENIQNGFHHDLYVIVEGYEAPLVSALLKKYRLPTHSSKMSADEKKIILASRKWLHSENHGWGADFVNPISGKTLVHYLTTFFMK